MGGNYLEEKEGTLNLFCYKKENPASTLPDLGLDPQTDLMLQAIGAGRASGLDAKVEEKQDICDQDSQNSTRICLNMPAGKSYLE